MPTYAEGTTVSTERSIEEIRRSLKRWGAEQMMWGEQPGAAMVEFIMRARRVRLIIPLPDSEDKEFKWTNHDPPRRRTLKQQQDAHEQAVRQRWRALNIVIKAKLEAVEAGISSFETEFLGHLVLPNGHTVGDTVVPNLNRMYELGEVPTNLLAIEG